MISVMTGARTDRIAAAVSLGLAVVASAALAVLPTGSKTVAVQAGEPTAPAVTRESLLEHEGASVLVVLALPVLAAAPGAVVGAAPRRRRVRAVSAGLLWAFTVLGAASVGLFYVPAALAMTVAACAPRFAGAGTTK